MAESAPSQRWRRGRAAYRPPDEPIRTHDYEVAELPDDHLARAFVLGLPVACGALPPASHDPGELSAWLRRWKARLCHTLRHRGNHRYAWPLSRRVRLPRGLPYPRQTDP